MGSPGAHLFSGADIGDTNYPREPLKDSPKAEGTGSAAACGSYDHRERCEVHYLWPEGHPVEEVLHERLSGPAEAGTPDGGRTGDVPDRLVVDGNAQSQDDLEPRTKRAVTEAMDVSLLSEGGRYEVQSASGN